MSKITRFKDIPQLTRDGHWECDFSPDRMLRFIDEQVKEVGLDTNPDFQRGHVWTEEQQVRYIEFFLRGGKTGRVIYLNIPDWNGRNAGAYKDAVLVDGKQRIEAWRRFLNNEIAVFGSYFHEFTDGFRIAAQTMKININTLQTRAEVLKWYIDMNAGGTPHTDEEIEKVRALAEADYHTPEALEHRAAREKKQRDKAEASKRYVTSLRTLVLTPEQATKVAAPGHRFGRFGAPVTVMGGYLPADPTIVFSYDQFGATWGNSWTTDARIVNTWIRHGIVEVVGYNPTPTRAKIRLGPNAQRFAEEFGVTLGRQDRDWLWRWRQDNAREITAGTGA